jgi:hypothetical protein
LMSQRLFQSKELWLVSPKHAFLMEDLASLTMRIWVQSMTLN